MAVAAPSVEGPEFAEKVRRADEITRRLQESNWDFDAVPELFTRAATCDVVAKEIVTIHDGRAQTLLGRLVMNGIGEEFQLNSPSSALNITLPGRPEVFKEINDQLGSRGLEDFEEFQGVKDIQQVVFYDFTNFYQARDLAFWSALYDCGLSPSGFEEFSRHLAAGKVVTSMRFRPSRPSLDSRPVYVQGFTGKRFPTPVVEWIPKPLFGGIAPDTLHLETLLTLDPTDLAHPFLPLVAEGAVELDGRRYYMRRFAGTSAKAAVRGPGVGPEKASDQ